MYQAFADTNPLPKDRNLIDYGFETYELVNEPKKDNNDKMQ